MGNLFAALKWMKLWMPSNLAYFPINLGSVWCSCFTLSLGGRRNNTSCWGSVWFTCLLFALAVTGITHLVNLLCMAHLNVNIPVHLFKWMFLISWPLFYVEISQCTWSSYLHQTVTVSCRLLLAFESICASSTIFYAPECHGVWSTHHGELLGHANRYR